MDNFCDDGEEFRFFDALEEVSSVSSLGSSGELEESALSSFQYDVWRRSPQSIQERRSKFLNWMESNLDRNCVEESTKDVYESVIGREVDGFRESSGAILNCSSDGDELCSSQSSIINDASEFSEHMGLKDKLVCIIGNSDDDKGCNNDELRQDARACRYREVELGQLSMSSSEEFVSTSHSSSSSHQFVQEGIGRQKNWKSKVKGIKNSWLHRLGFLPCVEDEQVETGNLRPDKIDSLRGARAQRVKVRQCRKKLKELSALYMWQDIQAHKGSILAMKFSPDGQYLSSAGEDGIVRVWQVVEDDGLNDLQIPEIDPSCLYFTANHLSKLEPLTADKEKLTKLRSLRKTSDSACVVFPPKFFHILEKPLHEFRGHGGEILDLSWSRNNLLLSASVDKTVRLWQVGHNSCLKIFRHNNYVTCIQFNPVDDNYFISGSIDGKVRIWAISGCQVVDWTDIKEIVSSVCYRPGGQGGVVGSITGNCCFYNVSDNHLQLDAQISLRSKKKSLGKRITGFQFLPEDSSKLMVTCADSQIRILQGSIVINKYKGLRNAGSHVVASFTSDGKRIVSAAEDSTVYVWNSISHGHNVTSQGQSVRSCERFSTNASVAIPWCGLKYGASVNGCQLHAADSHSLDTMPSSSPAQFSLSQEFFLESFPKGSATWPEENLPKSNRLAVPSIMRKSQYKFLKSSCQNTSTSHAWGLVIVTAGWDGRIKSFHNYGLPVST